MTSTNIEKELKINERVGLFLLEERQKAGRSVRTVARRLKIRRRKIQRWERGPSAPSMKVFFEFVQHYGGVAFFRAQVLENKISQEAYSLLHKRSPS